MAFDDLSNDEIPQRIGIECYKSLVNFAQF